MLCAHLIPSVLITRQNARNAPMFVTRETEGGTFIVIGLAVRESKIEGGLYSSKQISDRGISVYIHCFEYCWV